VTGLVVTTSTPGSRARRAQIALRVGLIEKERVRQASTLDAPLRPRSPASEQASASYFGVWQTEVHALGTFVLGSGASAAAPPVGIAPLAASPVPHRRAREPQRCCQEDRF
jgi:hypothetical protein